MVASSNCLHVATLQALSRAQTPSSSPYAILGKSKALAGSLSSIKLSIRGLLHNRKIFRSISVILIRTSVDTSSERGMAKDEETAAVTEHIIPIP